MHILYAKPPYRGLSDGIPARPVAGEVLIASASDGKEWDKLRDSIARLRRERPWAHIVLQLEEMDPTLAQPVADFTGACAVAVNSRLDRISLQALLQTEAPASIRDWLLERKPHLLSDVVCSIEFLLGFPGFNRCRHMTPGGRRKLHVRAGIPSPFSILRMRRALDPILWLQQNPTEAVFTAAVLAGFYDGTKFSISCTRLMGIRPSIARKFIGVRWLLWKWWKRTNSSGMPNTDETGSG